ncbi:MAG TPA: enoyl-CoA hydratase/isomerase family protein [bacterium]|nr:MAG: Fatty acid oxidation complex subunit alpha [bacterium ADurb.Bin236]HOY61748.1 enoyl-CoA hydratase/isomerase family protein [bacterium]HPI78135.1 enoyl-CoA hydratase/isomerase family protein [bacterium]HPN93412.1 enoyl-CoA hydratase/isomerase family protein [bacterium]
MTGKECARIYDSFTFESFGNIAIFRFKGKALFNAAGLCDMDQLSKTFKECGDSKNLRVIIVARTSEQKDMREYEEFIDFASKEKDRLKIHRMLNFYSQFIVELYSQDKFVISVDSGNIVAQFLNMSLACDYRIVADDTVIQKGYFKTGMVPKGGATFFLSSILGKSKAYELLLSENDITAAEALSLGLVDEIVPSAELETAAFKKAEHFARIPGKTLVGIKKLMNYKVEELKDYLKYENDIIAETFWKQGD